MSITNISRLITYPLKVLVFELKETSSKGVGNYLDMNKIYYDIYTQEKAKAVSMALMREAILIHNLENDNGNLHQ